MLVFLVIPDIKSLIHVIKMDENITWTKLGCFFFYFIEKNASYLEIEIAVGAKYSIVKAVLIFKSSRVVACDGSNFECTYFYSICLLHFYKVS